MPVGKWAGALFKGGKELFRLEKGKKTIEKKGRDGKKSKPKEKLKCGQGGKYGDLKKQSGEGKFDRDHIPSKQALINRATAWNGGKRLLPHQIDKVIKWRDAIAISREAHRKISRTHGGRNNKIGVDGLKLAQRDAQNLASAAQRDIDAMLEKIDEYDEDGGCRKAYKKAAKGIFKMKNSDYDRALLDLLRK